MTKYMLKVIIDTAAAIIVGLVIFAPVGVGLVKLLT